MDCETSGYTIQPNQNEDHGNPSETASSSSKWSSTNGRQVALTDSVVTYIANGLLPLCIVENKDFINILHLAQPSFTMPSRRADSQDLIPVKSHLINLMEKTEHICLTVDLWSNRSMK